MKTSDGCTTRREGYKVSQRKRKLVEEAFGWGKTIAGMAKAKVRELARVRFKFTFNGRLQSDPDAEAAGSRVKQTSRIGPALRRIAKNHIACGSGQAYGSTGRPSSTAC